MQTNYYFLRQLAQPLHEKLLGLKLMECFSQEKEELILGFAAARGVKNNYKQYFIRCSVRPEFPGLFFTKEYRRANKNTVDLWPEIYDLEVLSVAVFKNERAIKISLENEITIVLKLFGNRSNILIFEKNTIKWIFNQKLKNDFDIQLTQLNIEIDQSKEAFFKQNLNYRNLFPTFGKTINQYIEHLFFTCFDEESKWKIVHQTQLQLENPQYVISKIEDEIKLLLLPLGDIIKTFDDPIMASNSMFIYGIQEKQTDKLRIESIRMIHRELKHIEVWIENNSKRLKELQAGSRNEELGHIIMSNLHQIPTNIESIELDDIYRLQKISIKLKKDLSPQKNAENYYRKARNEKKEIENLETNFRSKLQRKQSLSEKISNLETLSSVKEIRKEMGSFENKKTPDADKKGSDLFKKRIISGFEIWIGKNAKNNDLLTLKYAKKDDLWLHARDVSGSHVIIKAKAGQKIPEYVVEKAAAIAAWYSKRKNDSLAPVIVTPKKYIRKIKGSADGQVLVEKETVVMVKPEDIID